MIYRLSTVVILMALYSPTLDADEKTTDELAFVEFIQFLGEWETRDGEWIDPNEFETEGFIKAYTELNTEDSEENDSTGSMAKPEQD